MARLALTDACIMTGTGDVLNKGTILIRDARIEAIGTNLRVPADAEAWSLKDKVIIPGMIDAHTHLGLTQDGVGAAQSDEDEVDDPIVPHLRAIDAINPEDIAFKDALRGGVTTVGVMPGSHNVICGQPAAVKVTGPTVEKMVVRAPVGMKIAFGERPKNAYGSRKRSPMTRMGIAAILREALVKVANYSKKNGAERNLRMEAMIPVMKKQLPLRAHAHRIDDIMTAVRIAKEFGLRLVIEHGTDAYKVAAELADAKVPVVHGPWIKVRGNLEQSGRVPRLTPTFDSKRRVDRLFDRSSGDCDSKSPAASHHSGGGRGFPARRAESDHLEPRPDHGHRGPSRQPRKRQGCRSGRSLRTAVRQRNQSRGRDRQRSGGLAPLIAFE